MTQTILVTGAAGFLGSHLTDYLLGEGHTIIGIDNLCTGNRANLAHLTGDSTTCPSWVFPGVPA